MITNPSTLGLFEARIGELLEAIHAAGALAYMDGANLNAIMGRFKPGEAGLRRHALQRPQDVQHAARRRRPGRGPGRRAARSWCRSCPRRASCATADGTFRLERPGERPTSIGRMRSLRRQHRRPRARVRLHPRPRRRRACARSSDDAVLAANYLKARLARRLRRARSTGRASTSSSRRRPTIKARTGVRTLDIAKRLIDKGYHPPTIYFPLIVEEAMLIEPTETESLETLDAFADALIEIAARGGDGPGARHGGAARRARRRLDEATAARQPNLRWRGDDRRPDALPGLTGALRTTERTSGRSWLTPARAACIVLGQRTGRSRAVCWTRPDPSELGGSDPGTTGVASTAPASGGRHGSQPRSRRRR